jgi:hypothetical protein
MRDIIDRRSSEGFRGAALRPKAGFKENDPEEVEEVGAPPTDHKKPAGGEPTDDSFQSQSLLLLCGRGAWATHSAGA